MEAFGTGDRGFVVDDEVSDGQSLRVQEELLVVAGHLVQIEVDHCLSHEVLALLQRKTEVVFDFTDKFTTLLGLFL